jgi:hypothetical protein
MTMNACTMRTYVDRHFAGTIAPEDERAMREHMPACDACRDRYRRHVLLARLDPQALPAEERIGRGLGLRSAPRVVAMRLGVAVTAAVAAMTLLRLHPGEADGFEARGHLAAPAPVSRVFAYDVRQGAPPVPAGEVLQNGHELAFAYENGAAKRRLAVFGVDEHGHVYWFHPAWTREADDPVAIPIELDEGRHELPEAVLQRFDGTHLEIRSVFTDDPVSVRQIEALLRDHPSGPLPLPGAVEASLTLEVSP